MTIFIWLELFLQRSVNAFFEAKSSGGVNLMEDHDSAGPQLVINIKYVFVHAWHACACMVLNY